MTTYIPMRIERICTILAVVLIGIIAALILVTWIINAAMPELSLHTILSSEGIRWFLGSLVPNQVHWSLIWIIFLTMALGTSYESGLLEAIKKILSPKNLEYRQRLAIRVILFEGTLSLIALVLLTCTPHAILLSITGTLFPSSFSSSIVPVSSILLTIFALSYGAVCGSIKNIFNAYSTTIKGLRPLLWILPIYMLVMELIQIILYIFTTG